MQKIIQISESEYDTLFEWANQNVEELEKRALTIAKECNKYNLSVDIDLDGYRLDSFNAEVTIDYDKYGLPKTKYRECPEEIRVIAKDLNRWLRFSFKKEIARRHKGVIKLERSLCRWRRVSFMTLIGLILSLIINIVQN